MVVLVVFSLSMNALAYYVFLSPKCNTYIEELKEKHREHEIVFEREGLVWTVILPPNSRVETNEVREAVYNDETREFEAMYNFTDITITNAKGWTKIIWGPASEFYPYDVPRIKFVFDG